MKHLKIIVGASTLVLAVSGAFYSNAETSTRKAADKPYSTTLYRPTDCAAISCGTIGTVSCNLYDLNPPSAPGKKDCNSASTNALVHQ